MSQLIPQLIFDIGMYKGEDTQFYLRKGFNVVAIEADPNLINHNTKRFQRFIDTGQLQIIHGAITAQTKGMIDFYRCDSLPVWNTTDLQFVKAMQSRALPTKITKLQVPILDLAEILAKYGIPYYMKIDIEGADHYCLDALSNFKTAPKYLSLESSKTDIYAIQEEFDKLIKLGYKHFSIRQQQTIPFTIHRFKDLLGNSFIHRFKLHSSGMFGDDLSHNAWLSKDDAIKQYRKIFRTYRMLGDSSFFQKNIFCASFLYILSHIIRTGLPGWYDTHAMQA